MCQVCAVYSCYDEYLVENMTIVVSMMLEPVAEIKMLLRCWGLSTVYTLKIHRVVVFPVKSYRNLKPAFHSMQIFTHTHILN